MDIELQELEEEVQDCEKALGYDKEALENAIKDIGLSEKNLIEAKLRLEAYKRKLEDNENNT